MGTVSGEDCIKMNKLTTLLFFFCVLEFVLGTALGRCDESEEHSCCYPAGEISVNNCDCDAGYLCNIYCTDMGYASSTYDGRSEVCCCDQ